MNDWIHVAKPHIVGTQREHEGHEQRQVWPTASVALKAMATMTAPPRMRLVGTACAICKGWLITEVRNV